MTMIISETLSLEQEFEHMVRRIQNTPKNKHSNNATLQETLALYGLYKQSAEGDVHGKRPSILNVTARAKYEAHKRLSGMPKTKAMQAYLDLVHKIEARGL